MRYQGDIFVSTGAFGRIDLEDMLSSATKANIDYIELSSGARNRSSDLSKMLLTKVDEQLKFLVHNYFPVPAKSFVLNLASDDAQMLDISREHCKRAIALAANLGAPFYSVHAGFCIHVSPEFLGKKLQGKLISKERGMEIFIESAKILGQYAEEFGVMLAIENNVVSPQNSVNGKNSLLLGVTGDDLVEIMQKTNMSNVRLLLDVAHLKVSSNSLSFDANKSIEQIAPWIIACHLSDNDGQSDTNDVLSEQSWFWEPLAKYLNTAPSWVLEVYNIDTNEINQQINLIKRQLLKLNSTLVNA